MSGEGVFVSFVSFCLTRRGVTQPLKVGHLRAFFFDERAVKLTTKNTKDTKNLLGGGLVWAVTQL